MIVCVDVDYRATEAVTACVALHAWSDAVATVESITRTAGAPAAYEPGEFYRRELPLNKCLVFDDPLAVRGNLAAETERLDVLVQINLANADRGFIPGNVRGQPQSHTPSLRGISFQSNVLRHGLAHSLKETVLAPGHAALATGERGFAIDALGNFDVHGTTRNRSAADVDALYLYIQAIE